MKLVDILARELTEWPIDATHAVITETKARSSNVLGVCFTESGPPVWHRDHWTILGLGCGEYVYWLTEHDIKNSFGLSQSKENIVSQSEWESARSAYLASIQPARDPEIAAVLDKPANPWRRNRGRKTPPVASGARVELKTRNGNVIKGTASSGLRWTMESSPGDIMQWRYAETQHAVEKPTVQTPKAFDPIALRDEFKRITADGAELSQKMAKLNERMEEIEAALRAEGFAIINTEV